MKNRRAYQKKAMLKNAAGKAKHYAGRAEKELSETAENQSGESTQDFVQEQLETGASDAGSAIHNTLRTSYAQYRWAQKTAADDYGMETRAKAFREKMKLSFMKMEAVKARWGKATHTGVTASTSRPISVQGNKDAHSRIVSKTGKGVSRLTEKVIEALKYLGSKVVKAVGSLLLALFSAGSVVVISVVFIAVVAVLFASPMGILFAGEVADPNQLSIPEIVIQANEDFGEVINEIVEAHPECSEIDLKYEYEDGHSWASYWPEVLAVFAVHSNLNMDMNVLVIDETKKQQLLDTFWVMHEIESEVTSEEIEVEVPQDENSSGQPENQDSETVVQTVYTLHITVSSKPVDDLAADFAFSQDQMDILHELLSVELRPYLVSLALPGGVLPSGQIAWPLPGYSRITTGFGELDAFGNPGHKGIDIPAPEGTPIYAAHGGTVLMATETNSYGNQVLLDDGSGTSTRYAHLSAMAVEAGQVVAQGQVIGYVGSTGDSTGNHLHFELMIQGSLVDPLLYVRTEG